MKRVDGPLFFILKDETIVNNSEQEVNNSEQEVNNSEQEVNNSEQEVNKKKNFIGHGKNRYRTIINPPKQYENMITKRITCG